MARNPRYPRVPGSLGAKAHARAAFAASGGFTAVSGAALSTNVDSNIVTLANIGTGVPLSITGGSYSKNGGAFATTPTTVSDGDTLRLRVATSSTNATTTTATVTIGGSPRTFSVTTVAAVGAALSIAGTLTSATVGSADTFAPAIAGGTAPYSLSLLAKNADNSDSIMPPGRALGTGADALKVVGTYTTAGSYRYTLRVTDSLGATSDLAVGPVAVAAAGVTAPTPANYQTLSFTDSRGDAHGVSAVLDSTGYKPTIYNRGVAGWIGPMSGHKVRLGKTANFGISGGSVAQAAANPRQAQNGTVTAGTWYRGSVTASGSDNKGYVQAGQAPEGLVFILLGTNGFVAGTGTGSSFADMQVIIAGILAQDPNKVIVLANELPKGIANDGTVTGNDLNTNGATFKAYSDNLKKLSFDSGDPLANPRVITVDTWASILDSSNGAIVARNVRGTLTDGLHPSAYGARLITQAIVARLSAVWSNWASLPAQIAPPASDGLVSQGRTIAAAQPYLNSNPVMTAGGNGTVLSTWATAPTAATVPEGWQISGTNVGNFTVVCDKTTTPGEWKLTISGTLSATSALIILQNNVAGTTISNGALFSLTDKLRPMVMYAIDVGSQALSAVSARGTIFGDTATKNRVGIAGAASGLGKINDFSDAGDGVFRRWLGEVLDLAEPNMQTTPGALTSVSSITPAIYLDFVGTAGDTVSAVIRVREAGIYRSAS